MSQPEAFKAAADQIRGAIAALENVVAESKTRLEVLLKESSAVADLEKIKAFIRKPWCVIPKGPEEYWLVVPSWSDVHAGWLHSSTDSYRIFVVNRFAQWFGEVPSPLRAELALPEPLVASVDKGILAAAPTTAAKVQAHLASTVKHGEKQWRVKPGHEFQLLTELIEMGALPFTPQPVSAQDLRAWTEFKGPCATLRDYQKDAWSEFLARGALGIFWPMSAGKTVIGCYALGRLKGRKLVVVPSRTLEEQWRVRIEAWVGRRILDEGEVDIVTYASYHRVASNEYTLMIPDEAHRWPSNTYSRFAVIRAKYRMAMTASPHREDGRSAAILAFSGHPLGTDWNRFITDGVIRPPEIRVRVLKNDGKKIQAAIEEVQGIKGRRVIFCDYIELGQNVARRLKCPFIFGETKDRLGTLAETDLAVISRVGDEGVSLPDLVKTVELAFHGGSRRQELQRVGRLFHAQGGNGHASWKCQHVVLMTEQEFRDHSRRLSALEERGLKVKVCDET